MPRTLDKTSSRALPRSISSPNRNGGQLFSRQDKPQETPEINMGVLLGHLLGRL